jgi:hypothetical protein
MANYYLMHHGVKGMKWGVRRTAAQLGHRVKKTADNWKNRRESDKERRKRSKGQVVYAKTGNKIQSKNDDSVLTRKTSAFDDPVSRKKRIDADIKEADDRVKFYGSKRAAKAAIADEADYAKAINRGKAFVNTLKAGSAGGLLGAVTWGIADGITGEALATGALSVGGPVTLAAGLVGVAIAKKANNYITKHAKDQLMYTDESEYGHDIVVAIKRND